MPNYTAILTTKARQWGVQHYSNWATELTEEEKTALAEYQGRGRADRGNG